MLRDVGARINRGVGILYITNLSFDDGSRVNLL